jgi:ubiquinone/menaquinone biosynthesis C-methylase UbiE
MFVSFREYIHRLRKSQFEKIVKYIKSPDVKTALEVGAGDGYQSRLLVDYLDKLFVLEYSENRLNQIQHDKIEYFVGDAENIEGSINNNKFDLIYSSHLIEHLPNPDKLFASGKKLLNDGGLMIQGEELERSFLI